MKSRLNDKGRLMRVATDDGSRGLKGLVTKQVESAILEDKPDCLYACGPTGMLLALAELCKQHDLPCQLSFEGLMRCGVGLCGSCELAEDLCARVGLPGGWLACHDGLVAYFGMSN
jgi:dihydroorotate dehydrogenase electron transfer subunit